MKVGFTLSLVMNTDDYSGQKKNLALFNDDMFWPPRGKK